MNISYDVPLLSIIVPVYNMEKYLVRCVNSIINQQFTEFELILVDDGSVDNSSEMCDEFAESDPRIRVIHKQNGGLGAARNTGLDIARGKFIGFVDSDDWIAQDMYAILLDLADIFDADVVSSSFHLTYDEICQNNKKMKTVIKVMEKDEKLEFYMKYGMKKRGGDFPVWNKIYRKCLFDEIRFPVNQLYEDVYTNVQLINLANRYIKTNQITYFYYQQGTSITRNQFTKRDFDLISVSEEIVGFSEIIGNKKIVKLAKMKWARAYYSLLVKIILYGTNYDENQLDIIMNDFLIILRKNYFLLLRSPMSISRKFIMTILCINPQFLKNMYAFISKLKGGKGNCNEQV